ncbi:unnamed protein product, partial [marine sediment metagenome]
SENGVKGVFNFIIRTYKFFANPDNTNKETEDPETLKILHQTIKKVENDIEGLKFNTAISQMMIFTNHCLKAGTVTRNTAETFAKLISPFAPHLAYDL